MEKVDKWKICGLFFVSGAAALIYQVLFSKQLAYVFGSMSAATNTVLATYMGGMALGAWLGGVVASRTRRPIIIYAACEFAIAIYCAATPLIFHITRETYVNLASGQTPDASWLLALRLALGSAGLLIPTLLMGVTLPLLARHFEIARETLGQSVGRLYAANIIGAGLGALVAGYCLLPTFGVLATTYLAVAANIAVAALCLTVRRAPDSSTANPAGGAPLQTPMGRARGWVAITILAVGGTVTLALEVNYIHLLAITAGNSTYAFSLMLFSFLIGLGCGAECGRWLIRRFDAMSLLAWLEVCLGTAILTSVIWINHIPEFFASFTLSTFELGWKSREAIRGFACFVAMFPATVFIGAIFTVAVECVGRAFSQSSVRMLGYASALNTLGNIVGVLVAGFLLLPSIGALESMKVFAGIAVMLGAFAAVFAPRGQGAGAGAVAAALVCAMVFAPPSLNYDNLTTGTNVYFSTQKWGHVIDKAESLDGGLTSINEYVSFRGKLLTLLTNGKFQGNNSVAGEGVAQDGFALAPLLHNAQRNRALVIGYGTGNTSRVLHDAGFKDLDIADLSADIFRLANTHLRAVNGGVTEQPGVHSYVTDGRNFLLLTRNRYDIISMEVNSIWFAGAAALYSKDFYDIAASRLADGGVLQQWMQLHHASREDIIHILGSVRASFKYVWLYIIGGQGVIIASDSPGATPSAENITAVDTMASMKTTLDRYGGAAKVGRELIFNPEATDRFLSTVAGNVVSDDNNAFLEYSTPKGNSLDGVKSRRDNMAMLAPFVSNKTPSQ